MLICWFISMSLAVIEFCSYCQDLLTRLFFLSHSFSVFPTNVQQCVGKTSVLRHAQGHRTGSKCVWCFIMTSFQKTPSTFNIKITGISKLKRSFQNMSKCNTNTVFAINTQTVLFLDHAHSGLSTRAAYLYITQQVLNATPHTFMNMLVFCLNLELLSDGNYIK